MTDSWPLGGSPPAGAPLARRPPLFASRSPAVPDQSQREVAPAGRNHVRRCVASLLHLNLSVHPDEQQCREIQSLAESARSNWPTRRTCRNCEHAPYRPGDVECGLCSVDRASKLIDLLLADGELNRAASYQGISLVELMACPVSRLIIRAVRECRQAARSEQ